MLTTFVEATTTIAMEHRNYVNYNTGSNTDDSTDEEPQVKCQKLCRKILYRRQRNNFGLCWKNGLDKLTSSNYIEPREGSWE